jgi:ribulose-phosphate 3-epimerase
MKNSSDIKVKNSQKIEISASIMCIDWLNAGAQLKVLEQENIDYLHWDIVDGRFAPDFTMGTSIINKFREECFIKSDYHLMVEEPSRIFDSISFSKGDIITIHQECCRNLHRDIINLRQRGVKVGVALNPGTSLEALDYIIEDIDVILIMTVNPGFMGQKLIPQSIRKIQKLKIWIDEMKLDTKISVDGNVSLEHIPEMVAAGADILVGGSSGLFLKDNNLKESLHQMRKKISQGLL